MHVLVSDIYLVVSIETTKHQTLFRHVFFLGKKWIYDELENMDYDEFTKTFFEEIPSGEESENDDSDHEDVADVVPDVGTADLLWDGCLEPNNVQGNIYSYMSYYYI